MFLPHAGGSVMRVIVVVFEKARDAEWLQKGTKISNTYDGVTTYALTWH